MKMKYLLLFTISTIVTLVAMLEWVNNASLLFFLLIILIVGGLLSLKTEIGRKMLSLGFGIATSWLIFYFVYQYQSRLAYEAIKSIPQERLIEFYETGDYSYIPEGKQYTWIGLNHQRIGQIDENRTGKIKAIGWKGNSTFGYYDIESNRIVSSIK